MSRLLVNRDFTEDGVEKKAGDEMLFEGKPSDLSIMFNASVSFCVYDCLKPHCNKDNFIKLLSD